MEDFVNVYKTDSKELDYLKCAHCGDRIERGIINVSQHFVNCLKNTNGLIIAKTDFERKILDSWSINVANA